MKKGFTLIELLIVVAIIGILAAVGAAVIPNLLTKTKITVVKNRNSEAISYISKAALNCQLGGEVTVMGRGGVVTEDCSIDPYLSQYSLEQKVGNIMGYLDSSDVLGNNPFDTDNSEGGFKIDNDPTPALGVTNCKFYQKPSYTLTCWSRFADGKNGVISQSMILDY